MKATTNDIGRERLRAELHAIVTSNNGVLNPRMVLDRARDPDNPLHGYFEWDDAEASEAYRLAQVGALIRHVRFTVVRADPITRTINVTTTRGYQSRPSMRQRSGGYESIDDILRDAAKRADLLGQVVRELSAYRRRYAELSELDPVWLAVDEARETTGTPSPTVSGEVRPGMAG
jgi:hypothetical protein